ncbi:MAG: tetratricopeptide repeat protein [Terriglobales bacterium]
MAAPILAQGPTANTAAKPELSGIGWLEDYAKLSNALYTNTTDADGWTADAKVDGWTELQRQGNDPSGLHWAVYERSFGNGRSERALVFEGTENILDVGGSDDQNNIKQAFGQTRDATQFEAAAAIAAVEFQNKPSNTAFVVLGHSKGGALAEYAAACVGARGISFNGSGLSIETLKEVAEHWFPDKAATAKSPIEGALMLGLEREVNFWSVQKAVGQNIVNVFTVGEPIQELTVGALGGLHLGRVIPINPPFGTIDPITLHSMGPIIEACARDNTPETLQSLAYDLLSSNWSQILANVSKSAVNSQSVVLKWLLAQAELYAGDESKAAAQFLKLNDGAHADTYRLWAESFIAVRGESPTGMLLVGDALVREGHYQDALAMFDRGLGLSPGDVALLNARGSLYALLQDSDASLADFRRAFPHYYSRCGGQNLPRCAPPKQFPPPPGCPPELCGGGGVSNSSLGPRCPDGSLPPCHNSGGNAANPNDNSKPAGVSFVSEHQDAQDSKFSLLGGSESSEGTSAHETGLDTPTLLYSNLQRKK